MTFLRLEEDLLRARRNAKWKLTDHQVYPAWIAETDYGAPPAVQAAIERLVREMDYGYPVRGAGSMSAHVADQFSWRMAKRFGWQADPATVEVVTSLDQAIAACLLAFTRPGEGVAVHTPCYPPFRWLIEDTSRRLHPLPLVETRDGFSPDGDVSLPADVRMLILCNPHNPTGRVLTREELDAVKTLAARHDLVVISDEIHADLTLDGAHIPLASLGGELDERVITLTSASKAFNIPGLRCGVMHFSSPGLQNRFLQTIARSLLGQPNVFGVDATEAAWEQGDDWLAEKQMLLRRNRDRVADAVSLIPGARMIPGEATYMAWIDLARPAKNRIPYDVLDEAGVRTMAGAMFDPAADGYVRFNFATSEAILDRMLDRMVSAFRR